MNITIGVDREQASRVAVDWVAAQPFAADATISLVTAFDLLVSAPVEDAALLEAEAARMRESLPSANIAATVVDGSIPNTLQRWSEQADVLVVGSHRTSALRSLFAGALPERLAAMATRPTVLVPHDWDGNGGDVVAGVADDESSDAAVEFAARLASEQGLPLRLVHVWSRPMPASDPVSLYLDAPIDVRDEQAAFLAEVAQRVRERFPDLEIYEHAQEGSAPSAFLASGRTASLIVVGSHRRGPIAAWVLGTVSHRLVTDSRVPVCVVPAG